MKALLIIPKFFSYEMYIKKELQNIGYDVNVVYENVDQFSIIAKIQITFLRNKIRYFNRYFRKAIGNNAYDIVVVIRAAFLSCDVIKHIKENSPLARLYMYQWDSVKNNPNALVVAPYFDKVSTFDIDDAKKYGWSYRPLFFINSSERTIHRKYDIAFICTLHSRRVKIFHKLKCSGGDNFLYLYSKFSHLIKERYFHRNSEYCGVSLKDVKFKSLSLEQANAIMGMANIVVDYTHPAQTGFTMRTCEAIGHRCKLVTNNKLVKNADFYNVNNVYVYDVNDFQIPESFMNSPYIEFSENIYERYSISNWIKEIIDYEQDKQEFMDY